MSESPTTNIPKTESVSSTIAPKLMDGLWHNNVALVQLLGLCPLLAVSTVSYTHLTLPTNREV